jgi:hypothetical protein
MENTRTEYLTGKKREKDCFCFHLVLKGMERALMILNYQVEKAKENWTELDKYTLEFLG